MVGKAGRPEVLCVVAEAGSMGESHLRRPESKMPEPTPWGQAVMHMPAICFVKLDPASENSHSL